MPRLCEWPGCHLEFICADGHIGDTVKRPRRRAATARSKEMCHAIRTSLATTLFTVTAIPHRQEQPRQLGRPGSTRPLRRPVREPHASTEICNVRERQLYSRRDHVY